MRIAVTIRYKKKIEQQLCKCYQKVHASILTCLTCKFWLSFKPIQNNQTLKNSFLNPIFLIFLCCGGGRAWTRHLHLTNSIISPIPVIHEILHTSVILDCGKSYKFIVKKKCNKICVLSKICLQSVSVRQ